MIEEHLEDLEIVVLSDDIRKKTGFAVNARLVCWALSKKWNVVNVGYGGKQSGMYEVKGREIPVIATLSSSEERDSDRKGVKRNIGKETVEEVIGRFDPDVIVSVTDPHSCEYICNMRYPIRTTIQIRELGQDLTDRYLLNRFNDIISSIDTDKTFEWVGQVPIDGRNPPQSWGKFMDEIDYPISMSHFGQNVFERQFGVETKMIPHAVDYRDVDATSDPETFLLGAVNRNQFRKQYPRLIESWGKFYDTVGRPDDVEFYIHADPDDSAGWPLYRYARKYGIADAVKKYEGVVSRERLMEIYNEINVFCSSTGGEGFGLTTVEAMSQGTPVVITDCTTSEELVATGEPSPRGDLISVKEYYDDHPSHGVVERALVDTDEFAETLVDYYENRDQIDAKGENAKQWVHDNLSWDHVADQWVEYMETVYEAEEL